MGWATWETIRGKCGGGRGILENGYTQISTSFYTE